MGTKVRFDPPCIKAGMRAELAISDFDLEGAVQVGVQLTEIMDYETEFKASWGQKVVGPAAEVRVQVPDSIDLGVGLYGLTSVSITQGDTKTVLTENDFGLQLLEVREAGMDVGTQDDVVAHFGELLRAREQEFAAGFGLPEGAEGANDYGVLVFVKDCLLTKHMRLGQYEVFPFGGLSVSDEVAFMQEYLHAHTEDSMPEAMAQQLADTGKNEQPSFVAHFPLVRAESDSDAARRAHGEVLILCGVLSMTRRAYPSPFATLVLDLKTNRWRTWVNTRSYTGNLAGGLISGEDPGVIRKYAGRARSDERLRLYLGLYRNALDDTESETKYFRLWSLLEVMAAHRVVEGDPLLDWAGNPAPVPGRKNGLRHVISRKDEIAYEYLRRTIGQWNVNFNYASQVQQSDWRQLVDIWYQHRNCLAHGGGCLPNDILHCDPKVARMANCKAAHDEAVRTNIDHYLSILIDTAQNCIHSELA